MKPLVSIIPDREPVENDARRLFTPAQREQIYLRDRGRCGLCDRFVSRDERWVAGHVLAHSLGGRTQVENGRIECVDCAPKTQKTDTGIAAWIKRMTGQTGQMKRRKERGGSSIQNKGFQGSRKFNGEVKWKEGE